MNEKILTILVLSSILLTSGIAAAQDELPLSPPPSYYGSITVNGQPASPGTTIIAKIGVEERGSITTAKQGFYGDDPGPAKLWIRGYQNEIGSTVTFYVSGVAAQQTATLSGAGTTNRVDLSFVGVPVPTSTPAPTGQSTSTAQPTSTTQQGSGSGNGGSSGGGGGGGGLVTGEPFDNILMYLVVYGNLIANTSVPFNFSKMPELGIYEILVVGNENENDVAIRVELLKGTSKLVKVPPDGNVFKNINIWTGSKKIREATIRFRVENSQITSGGLANSNDVKMYRWDGSKWGQLETTEITKDTSYTYYEAKTYALSPFAISGLKATTAAQPEITPAATKALKVSGVLPSTGLTVNLVMITGVMILLIVIFVIVLYFRRK